MYEDVIKSNIQLNESSNFATDFKGSITISLFFSGKLQNYSKARQRLRLSNVFDQKPVASS